jgi:hypothetical protein
MKHAFTITPSPNKDLLEIDYACEFTKPEMKGLFQKGDTLVVRVAAGDLDFALLSMNSGTALSNEALTFDWHIPETDRWSLSSAFEYRVVSVLCLRSAYVFLRRVMHAVEDAAILKFPLAPFTGLVQTFDVRLDVPKEVTQFEAFRRSILVRERK